MMLGIAYSNLAKRFLKKIDIKTTKRIIEKIENL